MDGAGNNGQGGTPAPPASSMSDAQLRAAIAQATGDTQPTETPNAPARTWGALAASTYHNIVQGARDRWAQKVADPRSNWQLMLDGFRHPFGGQNGTSIERAIGRGVLDFGNEVSNDVVGTAHDLAAEPLLTHNDKTVIDSPANLIGNEHFSAWAAEKSGWNPATVNAQRWLGQDEGGTIGFIQGATQFAAGIELAKPLTAAVEAGAIAGRGKTAVKVIKAASNAARIGVGAAIGTDPHAARLSTLAQQAPPFVGQPLLSYIAVHPDDSETMARVRNGLENTLLGFMTEPLAKRFLHGVDETLGRSPKDVTVKVPQVMTTGVTADGQAFAVPADAVPAAPADAPVDVAVPTTPAPAATLPANAVPFDSPEAAEAYAATVNRAHANASLNPAEVTPEQLTEVREIQQNIEQGKNPFLVWRRDRGTIFNFQYDHTPAEGRA